MYFQFRGIVQALAQDMARLCTGIWNAWYSLSCSIFLTVNNENVKYYLQIVYVAAERANSIFKIAQVHCTMIMFYEKILCLERLLTFKSQTVSSILKLLVKLLYPFIFKNTKKSRFYQNSLFLFNSGEKSMHLSL